MMGLLIAWIVYIFCFFHNDCIIWKWVKFCLPFLKQMYEQCNIKFLDEQYWKLSLCFNKLEKIPLIWPQFFSCPFFAALKFLLTQWKIDSSYMQSNVAKFFADPNRYYLIFLTIYFEIKIKSIFEGSCYLVKIWTLTFN